MTNSTQPIDFQELFAAEDDPDNAAEFEARVMAGTAQLRFQRNARRLAVGVLLALLLPPIQDFGLVLTQLMLVTVVPIGSGLVAEVLAPINSVGAILSAVLLTMRTFYKRLFSG